MTELEPKVLGGMTGGEDGGPQATIVEADETYIGGKTRGQGLGRTRAGTIRSSSPWYSGKAMPSERTHSSLASPTDARRRSGASPTHSRRRSRTPKGTLAEGE